MVYLVYLRHRTQEVQSTICKNKTELARLINNLDNDYDIQEIVRMDTCILDFETYCQKEPELETGNNEKKGE
jgi:hypothetical protein